jgi:hypothetical protein
MHPTALTSTAPLPGPTWLQRLWRRPASLALLALSLAGTGLAPSVGQAAGPASPASAFAAFSQATQGDEDQIEPAAQQFAQLAQARPGDPLMLAYAGASQAMLATTTSLPWRKMQHAEDGLARLDKALSLLQAGTHEGPGPRGTPVALDVRFVAANTFLALPSFFNRQARGAQLLAEVLGSPLLAQAPLAFQGSVWMRAAEQARDDRRTDDARRWLQQVVARGAPQAAQAQAQLKALGA